MTVAPAVGARLDGLEPLLVRAREEHDPLPSGAEISRTMIWDFAACVQDANPAYWDEGWSHEHLGHLVVPPTMLLTHSRYPPGPTGTAAEWTPSYLREPPAPLAEILDAVAELGFDVWTNAGREETYSHLLAPGDRVLTTARVECSEVKQTRLARGVFVTTHARHVRERDGAEVARSTNSLFCYPTSDATEAPVQPDVAIASVSPAAPVLRATPWDSLRADHIQIDAALPVLEWPLTFRDLVLAAQGTRHPVPLHTDREFARRAGSRDAYFSTLWQAGLVGRYVNDWAGPAGVQRSLRLHMMANICPGDTVTVRGRVTGRPAADVFDVEIDIHNGLSLATRASARVQLPT
jgi:acyl dehydratase